MQCELTILRAWKVVGQVERLLHRANFAADSMDSVIMKEEKKGRGGGLFGGGKKEDPTPQPDDNSHVRSELLPVLLCSVLIGVCMLGLQLVCSGAAALICGAVRVLRWQIPPSHCVSHISVSSHCVSHISVAPHCISHISVSLHLPSAILSPGI